MKTAALYLRSSKDRSDVSIDSQRRELHKLAKQKDLLIVHEFTDVVESGKDEDRPGFQRLLTELKATGRSWQAIMMYDTSRLARNQYVSHVFRHECKKRSIDVLFAMTPQLDGIAGIILPAVLHAVDEVHSFVSREKGRAGMAENVRRGFRAGGRAPRGYQLVHIDTGVIREGEQVKKSKLDPNDDAPLVRRYLQGRALNKRRYKLVEELKIDWPKTTLLNIEWNALTYAGNTVWNMRHEFNNADGYVGGQKRRPRAEWLIKRDTHPALITNDEAEYILAEIERAGNGYRTRSSCKHMLTGLVQSPTGDKWERCGLNYYRLRKTKGRGRCVNATEFEQEVWGQVLQDVMADEFIERLTTETRRHRAQDIKDPTATIKRSMTDLTAQISKTMDLAAALANPEPAIRKINELEKRLQKAQGDFEQAKNTHAAAVALATITNDEIREILHGVFRQAEEVAPKSRRDLLLSIIEVITLDPETLDCCINYRIAVPHTSKMASPRGPDITPILRATTMLKIA